MRYIMKLITAFVLILNTKLIGQSVTTFPNVNHPTIASVKVIYKAIPQTNSGIQNGTVSPIQAIPEGKIILKQDVNITKIYLKIVNISNNAILYDINYQTNASVINNNEGKKLFQNNIESIFISNGSALILKPYRYEIRTEDNQGNLSQVYMVIQ